MPPQEKQRQAKEAAKAAKAGAQGGDGSKKGGGKGGAAGGGNSGTAGGAAAAGDGKSKTADGSGSGAASVKSSEGKDDSNQVALFGHLTQYTAHSLQQQQTLAVAGSSSGSSSGGGSKSAADSLPGCVLALGSKFAQGVIVGGNARCIAMLNCLKTVMLQQELSGLGQGSSVGVELDRQLRPAIQHIISCRPLSVAMGNAIK